MQVEPEAKPGFFVRITRHGAAAFGWEICRASDSTVVHHASRLFGTRIEAIADSALGAATLNIAGVEFSVPEGVNRSGD
jgi:hypothetical protein